MSKSETQRLYCTFRVNGRLFGVNILDVKEVSTETTSTRIPHGPEEVLGLVNIRGHIHLVLDLKRMLGFSRTVLTADSRVVLLKPTVGQAFGIIVDQISDILAVDQTCIEPCSAGSTDIPMAASHRVDLITSVCRLPQELLIIVNPHRLLPAVEQSFSFTV